MPLAASKTRVSVNLHMQTDLRTHISSGGTVLLLILILIAKFQRTETLAGVLPQIGRQQSIIRQQSITHSVPKERIEIALRCRRPCRAPTYVKQ